MIRIVHIMSLVLSIINFLQIPVFCTSVDTSDIAIYGLTEAGKIYYRKGSDWVILDDTTNWAHIAAGPNGQLYGITAVIYKSEEDRDNPYPTTADIEKWPTLLDGGDVSVRAGVTAENPVGTEWVQIPSRRLTRGRLDHFIGIAAGKNKVMGCTVPKYRDIVFRSNPLIGNNIEANAAAPWQETRGTAYGVAMDPVNDTMFIIDDWQRYSGGNTYSSVIGHIYKRNASDSSGWDNISPYCIGDIDKDNMKSDQYLGEEGWGKTLHVCATNSNIIQIAAGNNTLFGVGKDGTLFVNTNPNKDKYTALAPAPIKLPALYTLLPDRKRPFIAAGVKKDGTNEVWLVQQQTIQKIQQSQLYHAAETTQTSSQGFMAGRILETASFIFRRKNITLGNQTGSGWELVYSSVDAIPEQTFIFKEIAVGSLKVQ